MLCAFRVRAICLTLVFSVASATAVAAGQSKQAPASRQIGAASSDSQAATLAQRVDALEATVSRLNKTVLELQGKVWSTDFKVDSHMSSAAVISTEQQTYALARTEFGPFAVVCKAVSPYLDGYKVKLIIGNMTSANFSGAKFNISWGVPIPNWESKTFLEDFEKYQKSQKQKEFEVTNEFPGGTYTEIELSLTPANPDEIKNVSVGLSVKTISLRNSPVR